jgi:hypothetical protein
VRIRAALACALTAVASLAGVSHSGASDAGPTPGTAGQVASLVAASSSITSLDATVSGELVGALLDSVYRLYPSVIETALGPCVTATGCVFGDKGSSTTVVLYGDSHASMWLPALAPYAKAHHWRLVLLYHPACPAIQLPTAYSYTFANPNAYCTQFYSDALTAIHALAPKLVLIAERTAQVFSEPSGAPFTAAQWRTSLEATIRQMKSSRTKVAVIEDLVWFESSPPTCLASYPSSVQASCAVPDPNLAYPGQQVAEQQAARATGAGFITTDQWFCTTTCSPIVGDFITHLDQGHVSATYSRYLSTVLGTAVAAKLK